jgi:hypothetical protein
VDRALELSISRLVQSVPGNRARRRLDGRSTAEPGEGSLGTDLSAMRPGGDDLTGDDSADSQLVEQFGNEPMDQPVELHIEFGGSHSQASTRRAGGSILPSTVRFDIAVPISSV